MNEAQKISLAGRKCKPAKIPPDEKSIAELTAAINSEWAAIPDSKGRNQLVREFRFGDYKRTLDFVNAVAAFADAENHHPEIHFGYNRCRIAWTTHSVGGLSENDFICAAKTDSLI